MFFGCRVLRERQRRRRRDGGGVPFSQVCGRPRPVVAVVVAVAPGQAEAEQRVRRVAGLRCYRGRRAAFSPPFWPKKFRYLCPKITPLCCVSVILPRRVAPFWQSSSAGHEHARQHLDSTAHAPAVAEGEGEESSNPAVRRAAARRRGVWRQGGGVRGRRRRRARGETQPPNTHTTNTTLLS